MKLYKYLYYRFYKSSLNAWGPAQRPEWHALFSEATLMAINIMTIIWILDSLGMVSFFNNTNTTIYVIIIGAIIWIGNYLWLVKDEKYKKIAEEYQNETNKKRLRNTILLWIYVIMSFSLIILLVLFQFYR